jgi:CubicO group peptidase (beta-lactamase class C family)
MTQWLDAASSDPATLQWMVGSPPPADKLIQFADGSAFQFPRTRWSYSNIRRLVPTSVVQRGHEAASPLLRAERTDLDAITFQPTGGTDLMTWEQSLAANFTDGILVLHHGRVIYERYFGVLDPATPHLAFSVTKSFVATIAGSVAAEGTLDDRATVASYLPELKHSGFADATIAHLLDMTTGVKYTEDYIDDKAGIWALARAGNFRPRPADYRGPGSFYEYLQTVEKDYGHGERFAYKTANTDVLAWVLRRVTRKTISALMFDYLWSKLGVEQDAYFTIDTTGVEFAGAGLNLSLRDLARFGEMMRLGGRYNGHQIVPPAVIDDIRAGGNRELFADAGYTQLPGWSYRRMWWVSHNDHGAFAARGIHGQAVYIDPAAEMVVARFASHPQGANVHLDPTSLPAYHALAKHLLKTPS